MEEDVKKNNTEIEEVKSGTTEGVDVFDENVLDEVSTTQLYEDDDTVLGICVSPDCVGVICGLPDSCPSNCSTVVCSCDTTIDSCTKTDGCYSDSQTTYYWMTIWAVNFIGQKRSDGWCRYKLPKTVGYTPTTQFQSYTAYTTYANYFYSGTGMNEVVYFWKSGTSITNPGFINGNSYSVAANVNVVVSNPVDGTVPAGHAWKNQSIPIKAYQGTTSSYAKHNPQVDYGYTLANVTKVYLNAAKYKIVPQTQYDGIGKAGCHVCFYNATSNALIKSGYTYSQGATMIFSGSSNVKVVVGRYGDAVHTENYTSHSGQTIEYYTSFSGNTGHRILTVKDYQQGPSFLDDMRRMKGGLLPYDSGKALETVYATESIYEMGQTNLAYKYVRGDIYGSDDEHQLTTIHGAHCGESALTINSGNPMGYLDESIATASTILNIKCKYGAPWSHTFINKTPTKINNNLWTFTASCSFSMGFGYGTNPPLGWPEDGSAIYAALGQMWISEIKVAVYARAKTGSSYFYRWIPAKIRYLASSQNQEYLEDGDDGRIGPILPMDTISCPGVYGEYPTNDFGWTTSSYTPTLDTNWKAYDIGAKLFFSGCGYNGTEYGGCGFWRYWMPRFSISARSENSSYTSISAYSACVVFTCISAGSPTWYYQH